MVLVHPNTDPSRHLDPRAAKDSAKHIAQIRIVPPSIRPRRFRLIAPVSVLPSVEPREFLQQMGLRFRIPKMASLFPVEVIDAITIDFRLPAGPVLWLKRFAWHLKRLRMVPVRMS